MVMRVGIAYMRAKMVTVLGTVSVGVWVCTLLLLHEEEKLSVRKAQKEIADTTVITEAKAHY